MFLVKENDFFKGASASAPPLYRVTQVKVDYAQQMFESHKMHYAFIPSKYADMILQEFISQRNDASTSETL